MMLKGQPGDESRGPVLHTPGFSLVTGCLMMLYCVGCCVVLLQAATPLCGRRGTGPLMMLGGGWVASCGAGAPHTRIPVNCE